MLNNPTVLTFSGEARHGKNMCAGFTGDFLKSKDRTCIEMAYGNYLKYIARTYYGWDGNKDTDGRSLLQWLGEFARSKNTNCFVDQVIKDVNMFFSDRDYILITDCRYPNEITRWKELGFNVITFRIMRPTFDNSLTEEQRNHISEVALNEWNFDYTITNEEVEKTKNEVHGIIERIIN